MALTDSLISYWKLDEASGDAADAHGSNALTDYNTVGTATGKINDARDFERSTTEFFAVDSNSSLQAGDIDLTIAAWIKMEATSTNMTVVSKWRSADGFREYRLDVLSGGTARMLVSGNGTDSTIVSWSSTLSVDTWYWLLGWHDATNDLVGINVGNGTPVTASHTTGIYTSTTPFMIGAATNAVGPPPTGTLTFDGLIDEVGLWKRLLTSGEQSQLYNSGSGLAYPFSSSSVIPVFRHHFTEQGIG